MLITKSPDTRKKIELLNQMAELDRDGDAFLSSSRRHQAKAEFLAGSIFRVQRSDGPMVVMRILQTSVCERNCRYCAFRSERSNAIRVSLKPEELASTFYGMHQARIVKGLFLSSGITGNGIKAMDPMLATAELLRNKHRYQGYIHLKIMPGAETSQIEQAMKFADRVSVNLEGVDASRLAYLAPEKDFDRELMPAVKCVQDIAKAQQEPTQAPSLATQFVVGPAGESDRDLLTTVDWLYRKMNLARAYYSAFSPVPDTPLENQPQTSTTREHRLYQADWLLRFYEFTLRELPFDTNGTLPQGIDPKLAWAQQNLVDEPIEVNRANRTTLLRVPGIGPRSANAILYARLHHRLKDLGSLKALGIAVDRASPFILLNGRIPPRQLSLWDQV